VNPKEQSALASLGERLLNSPRSTRRKLTVTDENPKAAQRQAFPPERQTIPIDRLLAEYGKTHLQLTVAEETIQRQQGQIAALARQLQDALKKLADAQLKDVAVAEKAKLEAVRTSQDG
jgi:hypothetical protein